MKRERPALVERIESMIANHSMLEIGQRVVVGVSGGVDSVVLTHALDVLGYEVIAAHVNYGLRGEESNQDETLVRRMADLRNIRFEVVSADARGRARADGTSVQAAARAIRYEHFVDVARTFGAHTVAVAHHAEDQAETVLMHLLRGSGPEGLAGMKPCRRLADDTRLIRPLLTQRRADIEAFARENDIPWREDASNRDDHYRRSRVRYRLLPVVEEALQEDVVHGITVSAGLMRDYVRTRHRREIKRRFRRSVLADGRRALSVEALVRQPDVWQSRILLRAVRMWIPGFARRTVVAELKALIGAQAGRRMTFGDVTVWRERDALVFEEPLEKGFVRADITAWGKDVRVPGGTVRVERTTMPTNLGDHGSDCEFVSADALSFPLTVRVWRRGDRFEPLGMDGSQKVSDLLTNTGVPSRSRDQQLVVESAGEIVWVIGVRLSNRFRVESAGGSVAKMSFIPDGLANDAEQ